jgi:hypothetical protein
MHSQRPDQNTHFGPTYNTALHGVAPHTLVLGGNQGNTPPERSIFEHIAPQPDQVPQSSLCSTVTTRHLDGEKSRKLYIHHPEINRHVCDSFEDRGELWNVAYALRHLRRQYLTSGPLQDLEFILESVEEAIHLDLEDAATSRVTVPDDHKTIIAQERSARILYSIIMLSYGAEATLSYNGGSHSAHLEDVLLGPCDYVTLVFKCVGKHVLKRRLPVFDLPRLGKYGIVLDLGSFRKFLSELPELDAHNPHSFHNQLPVRVGEGNPKIGTSAQDAEYATDERQESSTNTLYGCTFSKCFQQFKEKSDWRKHEMLQHSQRECWQCTFCLLSRSCQGNRAPRCETEYISGQVETPLYYDRGVFIRHLRSTHSVDEVAIALQAERRRIGRMCKSRFWCGFCREIVVLQEKGLGGSHERFNHIDQHFLHGSRIEGWSEMDGSGVKGKEGRGGNGLGGSQSEGYHVSAASHTTRPECDTALRRAKYRLEVQSHAALCDRAPAESVVDDDWDADFNPRPLLDRQRSTSPYKS